MERHNNIIHLHCPSLLYPSIIICSGVVSLTLCLAAEFKKSKKKDLRIEGNQCYLPKSAAFGLGIAALVCLCAAQIIGNIFVWTKFKATGYSGGCKLPKPTVSCSLMILSWISFVLAVILISGASSMSQVQPFGKGWLDGDCYLVKNGVYTGSALLGLLALCSALGSGFLSESRPRRRIQVDENRKVETQDDPQN